MNNPISTSPGSMYISKRQGHAAAMSAALLMFCSSESAYAMTRAQYDSAYISVVDAFLSVQPPPGGACCDIIDFYPDHTGPGGINHVWVAKLVRLAFHSCVGNCDGCLNLNNAGEVN